MTFDDNFVWDSSHKFAARRIEKFINEMRKRKIQRAENIAKQEAFAKE